MIPYNVVEKFEFLKKNEKILPEHLIFWKSAKNVPYGAVEHQRRVQLMKDFNQREKK